MSIEIKAPTFPESVQEGSIATWHKQPGETVSRDELLVDIETDKVVLEVVAPVDGILAKTLKEEGAIVLSNEVIAVVNEGEVSESAASVVEVKEEPIDNNEQEKMASPSARKLASEQGVDLQAVEGSGKDGRITKEDVAHVGSSGTPEVQADSPTTASPSISIPTGDRIEKRVPMTRMRARIADRLLQVTQTTAMLTTFNEADMHKIMDLRSEFKEEFSKIHPGARLGFMGFFVRAATEALKRFPSVNASIDSSDVIYHGYQDIGIAVSTEKGLVVPVLRNAENMSIADVERTIAEFGAKARDGKLTMEEMTGGTFTITNGGVFGSLLSTPILNPPQAAILGMHSIKERPIAENGSVVIRPMMNLALSYDHRIIDGREAVSFLVAIKEMIENPAKILLEI
ncbi:MAG: 2-oxoglutarate dehydrogenase E2 component (dihydrolipoamide succinyltransferase) [Porticoccus sp.]|jgi:2-oxoglutarate dehydrogenase E2 component (dihydrolipoamide succinyltransferase)